MKLTCDCAQLIAALGVLRSLKVAPTIWADSSVVQVGAESKGCRVAIGLRGVIEERGAITLPARASYLLKPLPRGNVTLLWRENMLLLKSLTTRTELICPATGVGFQIAPQMYGVATCSSKLLADLLRQSFGVLGKAAREATLIVCPGRVLVHVGRHYCGSIESESDVDFESFAVAVNRRTAAVLCSVCAHAKLAISPSESGCVISANRTLGGIATTVFVELTGRCNVPTILPLIGESGVQVERRPLIAALVGPSRTVKLRVKDRLLRVSDGSNFSCEIKLYRGYKARSVDCDSYQLLRYLRSDRSQTHVTIADRIVQLGDSRLDISSIPER